VKEVKIVWISHISFEGDDNNGGKYLDHTKEHEGALTKLVNEGWRIITAGGGHGYTQSVSEFVILQRER
jgi:hypothetical protein